MTVAKLAEFRHATPHRTTLLNMARKYDWTLLVEIGVRLAGTGAHLLANKPNLVYVGIDPFLPPAGTSAEPGFTDYGQPDMEEWYHEAIGNLAPYTPRGVLWKIASIDAASRFRKMNAKADCVFIDGDHREAAVIADIDAWRGHVKPGGWLTGHDYDWPSVRAAVHARLGTPEQRAGNVWTVQL